MSTTLALRSSLSSSSSSSASSSTSCSQSKAEVSQQSEECSTATTLIRDLTSQLPDQINLGNSEATHTLSSNISAFFSHSENSTPEQFEKYFNIAWLDFVKFLRLRQLTRHGLSQSPATQPPLRQERLKFEVIQGLMKQVWPSSAEKEKTVQLFTALAMHDTMPSLYLSGDIDEREVFDNVIVMAKTCDYPIDQLYRLLILVDCIETPPGNQKLSETHRPLLNRLEAARQGGDCFNRLLSLKSWRIAKNYFIQNIDPLLAFLEKSHVEMLLETDLETTQPYYQRILGGFREFILSAACYSDVRAVGEYLDEGYHTFSPNEFSDQMLFSFLGHEIRGKTRESIIKLHNELIRFNKNYLCRFAFNEIEEFVVRRSANDPNQEAVRQ